MSQLLDLRQSDDIGVVVAVMLDLDELEVAPRLRCKSGRAAVERARMGEHIARLDSTQPLGVEITQVEVDTLREGERKIPKLVTGIDHPCTCCRLVVLYVVAVV